MASESPHLACGSGRVIPDDIFFFHILPLLPVECLVRFQTVCKSWRTTITCTNFVRRHLELSGRTRSSMVLVPRKYQKDITKVGSRFLSIYSFQPEQSKIAELIFKKEFYPYGISMFSMPLHCDGLILIPCMAGKFFICNPATREFVELPPGTPNVLFQHRVAFGFDPFSGTYKVARPFIRSYRDTPQIDGLDIIREYSCGHEILTLGDNKEAWEWKATMDPPYPIKARTPICLPGSFFWSAFKYMAHGMAIADVDVILRFSLLDETFTVHPNPPCRDYLSKNDVLSAVGGKLCYIHSATPWEIAIWLAEEDGPNLIWSLCRRVCLPAPRDLRVYACASTDPGKIFLSIDGCHLFKCNLHDGSLEEIIYMPRDLLYDPGNGTRFSTGELPYAHYMVPFVESLLPIKPK